MNPHSPTPPHLSSPPPLHFSVWLQYRLRQLSAGSSPAIIWLVPLWRNSDSTHRRPRHQLLLPKWKARLSLSISVSPTSTPTHLQSRLQLQLCSNLSLASTQSLFHLFSGSSARLAPAPTLRWYGHDSTLAPIPFWLHASFPPTLALTHLCPKS